MKAFPLLWLGLFLSMRLCAGESVPDAMARRNDAGRECLENMMGLYRAGNRSEALRELERGLAHAKAEFGDNATLYTMAWDEAQLRSGNADEEWGLDLFLLLLKSTGGANSAMNETDYLIHGNIGTRLRATGRITEARGLASRQQASLATHARLNTANRPYRDLGPLFGFLPDARKRQFPLREKDVSRAVAHEGLLDYPRMYAVNDIAMAALDIGDWVRAAELYRWFADYATEYCKQNTPRTHEVTRISLLSYGNLAAICHWHGFPAEADALYGEFIALVDREGYPVEEAVLANAKLSQLVIRGGLGTLPPNAVEIAEKAADTIDGFAYYGRPTKFAARVQVARIHHATGNHARAWEIIRGLEAKAKADVNPHHLMQLLNPMIDFALDEGGTHPELEEWLARRLRFERSMGNKFNELPLYEKYARFLRLNGRLAEAAEILGEAIRLSVAMNIPFRAEKNRTLLAEILNTEKIRAEEEARRVDIQPVTSRSVVITGSLAHGRFHVTNPSSQRKSGSLRLSGPITRDTRTSGGQLTVALDSAAAVGTVERPLVLEPGASFVVDVTGGNALEERETGFSCAWMERGEPVSEGTWVYKSSDAAARTSVVDAHAVKISPFHLIPIRHMIQRTGDAAAREEVDFRITASKPMRIEVYDASGTKLICVDSNGNGDFLDKGDLVHQDLNRNGHPDLTLGEGETLVSLTMYVEPEQLGTEGGEVTLSILEDGTWRVDAVDLIK
jgi:hypothetical protein